LDILGPLHVIGDGIHAQPDDLAVALLELRLEPRHVTELRGADRREVLGMREQDGPAVADPPVEVDRALRRLRGEIRCFAVDSERHTSPPGVNGTVQWESLDWETTAGIVRRTSASCQAAPAQLAASMATCTALLTTSSRALCHGSGSRPLVRYAKD